MPALDAFVLLEIFDYIDERLRVLNIDYDINQAIGRKAKNTNATMGQIQSCFFSSRPVREIVRPMEVWPKVMWAWAPWCERDLERRSCVSQLAMKSTTRWV